MITKLLTHYTLKFKAFLVSLHNFWLSSSPFIPGKVQLNPKSLMIYSRRRMHTTCSTKFLKAQNESPVTCLVRDKATLFLFISSLVDFSFPRLFTLFLLKQNLSRDQEKLKIIEIVTLPVHGVSFLGRCRG